jgi:hypothetical protein
LSGCGQGTPGGTEMTETTVNKPIYGQAEGTFNLSVPMMATSLQQGATLETEVGIDRGTNFGEDVSLKFTDLPQGVTVAPASPVIKHGDEYTKITFTADATATLGDYKVQVSGHPENGNDAEVEFKLNITAIDTFTLSTPTLSTSLKQNASETISIEISRDKTLSGDVSLTFGDLPKGLTMQPAQPTIKQGENEATVTMNATADAALGDFTIKVTGHPPTGQEASKDLKVTVISE